MINSKGVPFTDSVSDDNMDNKYEIDGEVR